MKARKDLMLEAEKKSLGIAKVILCLITSTLFLLCHTKLIHTYLYDWQHRAGRASLIGGVLFMLAMSVPFAEGWISNKLRSETAWYIIWIILFGFAIAASCGFNFTIE